MPKFRITMESQYTVSHTRVNEIEADTIDAAVEIMRNDMDLTIPEVLATSENSFLCEFNYDIINDIERI